MDLLHNPPPPPDPNAPSPQVDRGAALVAQMRGRATRRFTTDEIMEMTRGEK